jgi:hypothetical protein
MKKRNFISTGTFYEKYSISANTFFCHRINNKVDDRAFKKEHNQIKYIDENYFLRRLEFKNKIQLIIESYYFVLERYFNESSIAHLLHIVDGSTSECNYRAFLQKNLFALSEQSLTDTKITKQKWKFFRIVRGFLRRAFNKVGRTFRGKDLNVLLYRDEKFICRKI